MYQIKLKAFQGPLDLLLKLIEGQELDITQISLSQVTEQYLDYLNQIEQRQPDELADFLVIAAKLIYIKSKVLLPNLDLQEEDNAEELARQLKLYKKFVAAAKLMEARLKQKKFAFSREKLICDLEVVFNPPKSLDTYKIKRVFLEIIKAIEPIIKLPQRSLARAISMQQKISQIKDLITNKLSVGFNQLISQSKSRTEVVITFLGVLELVKQQYITIKQAGMFGEMEIEKLETGN